MGQRRVQSGDFPGLGQPQHNRGGHEKPGGRFHFPNTAFKLPCALPVTARYASIPPTANTTNGFTPNLRAIRPKLISSSGVNAITPGSSGITDFFRPPPLSFPQWPLVLP